MILPRTTEFAVSSRLTSVNIKSSKSISLILLTLPTIPNNIMLIIHC